MLHSYWAHKICFEVSPARSQLFTLQSSEKQACQYFNPCYMWVQQGELALSCTTAQLTTGMHTQNEVNNTTHVHGIILYFTEHFPYLTNLAKHTSEPVTWMVWKKINALLKWKRFSYRAWKTTIFSMWHFNFQAAHKQTVFCNATCQ